MFNTAEGCIPDTVRQQAIAAMDKEPLQLKRSTVNDGKQSVGHDVAESKVNEVFASARPSIIVGERDTSHGDPKKNIEKVSGFQVRMSTVFEHQFNSAYLSRVSPWVLKYSCGGAVYPDLFSNWGEEVRPNRRPRISSLDPGTFAQMLSTRCEAQLGSDWLLVPAARNLHWRYTVLRNAFCLTKKIRHFRARSGTPNPEFARQHAVDMGSLQQQHRDD